MRKIVWLFIFYLFISAPGGFGQQRTLTAEVKKQTIEDLTVLLAERYAYKEIGLKLQHLLEQNLKTGKYDAVASAEDFSLAVTDDLRSLNGDRHLALNYHPQTANATPANSPAPPPEERARQIAIFNRQMNFGFKQVQFLNGNIGYLKLDYFDSYLEYSGSVADAAMLFFKNSDALIIDLRDNGGGSGLMVAYLAGFFFKERTLSGTSYNRLTDTTEQEFISPQPKEKQLADMDLYILTSKATVSAAEGLAYHLKYLKQAKVIGETSAGAANPGRITRLNPLFTAFIPNRYGAHVVTGTNWEGTGVPVDLVCPAEEAVRIARLIALKTLRQKTTDVGQQKKFDNYITYLEKTSPEKELSEKALRQYAGDYQGGRSVILKNGKLYYFRVAELGGQLHFISPDLFMLGEGDTTIRFKRDKQNRVNELESQWSLSSAPAVAAKIKSS